MSDPLETFSEPVRVWFRETFAEPTPPQAQGWLPIQRGEHTLILAPTGSGKTLAAFLWGIDELYRELSKPPSFASHGVRLLYVSPLKALNNDIERNLRVPLEGIRATAARLGENLAQPRVAVRTGDTPGHVRAAMWKNPPHILITTPESLYLMLTSPRAREMFRTVRTVIVDEIHTVCGNKRGVHLLLSLERLCHLAESRIQRIGLSATIRPLEEAARFLGGQAQTEDEGPKTVESDIRPPSFVFRPVTIVNATYHKPLDLQVVTAVDDFRNLPGETIWPVVVPRVLNDIRQHRTTLIFCNNRRLAERTADRLNAQLTAEESEEIPPGSTEALAPGGIPRDRGIFALGAEGPLRAHHGSMSKEARRKMEEDLKAGRLPALVGTSSLELGIDIGAVDLVVQLQSPKSVAQGLQRVGRSGHIVGETSRGKIYATFREDLVEAAAIARGMLEGDVELTYTPQNPLDVLAQQIVAMVACEDWSVPALYDLVRGAYAYRDLSLQSFYSVLNILAGKYHVAGAQYVAPLRARISWNRVNNRLSALPGSRLLAMSNAGTISDTGAYPVYLSDGKTKVGELDEEFVFETRIGDAFLLGSHTWRVLDIQDDRIIVGDAAGAVPRMPFWNGDYPWRPYELGVRIGRFRREVRDKIRAHPLEQVEEWLRREYALDQNSARNLVDHVQRQLDAVGVMSSDTIIVVETFLDAVGEPRMVIHSPYGGRVNGAWALALTSALRKHAGVQVETQTNDDGIIFRFPQTAEPPVDMVQQMTPAEARERILRELPNSAVFGAHFRMNAARALLLPKARGRKRTPFWLQRLKAKDLLALVRKFDDFPIVAETYRDCLRDVLDLPHLEEILEKIQRGEIRVVPIETVVPSPVAAGLLFQFISVYMYEWDAPKAERQLQSLALRREALDDLLQGVTLSDLKPEAVGEVETRIQHSALAYQARSAEELALILHELGDLTTDEIIARCVDDGRAWLAQLSAQNRVMEVEILTRHGAETRWVPVELAEEYRALTSTSPSPLTPNPLSPLPLGEGEGGKGDKGEGILRRFFRNSGPVTREAILDRYTFDEAWLDETLARLVAAREIVQGHFTPLPPRNAESEQYCDRHNLEQIHRRTLMLLRKEVQPVSIFTYADFLTHWQHLPSRLSGDKGLRNVLEQLRGVALPATVWERDALPARIADFDARDLDALCQSGELVWVAQRNRVRFFFRGEGALFLDSPDESKLSADARKILDFLKSEGASFTADLVGVIGRSSLQEALTELVTAGLVTNDTLDVMRLSVRAGVEPPLERSGLEAELAERLRASSSWGAQSVSGSESADGDARQSPRALTRARYRAAKRRVAQRMRAEIPQTQWQGRWSLVHRASVMGPPLTEEERADKLARLLLARYGVVTRECLEREEIAADWSLLYPQFQRMEMRGEVRRGYFVRGLSGAQFALPEAVEKLRAADASTDDALIVLNAMDPANVFGGLLADAPRFARLASTHIVLQRGQPILIAEDNGERITTKQDINAEAIRRALQVYLSRPILRLRSGLPRHIVVKEWNGADVLGGEGEAILHSLGFYRIPKGMEL